MISTMIRSTLTGLLLSLFVVGFAHAEPVRVRAALHGDSGRMAFNWDVPVSYQATISGTTARIRFDREIEADLSIISRTLKGYVTAARFSADSMAVELELTKTFQLVHFPAGTAIVVDLVGAPGTAGTQTSEVVAPVAEPEQTAAVQTPPDSPVTGEGNESLPSVSVRTGRHADKLRVVFDWADQVPARLERDGGIVRLIFDAPARIAARDLVGVQPAVIGDAHARVSGEQSIVSLAVAQGAKLRLFKAGAKSVLDIYYTDDGSRAGALPAVAQDAPVSVVDVAPVDQSTTDEAPSSEVQTADAETADAQAAVVSEPAQSDESSAPESDTATPLQGETTQEQLAADETPMALEPAETGQATEPGTQEATLGDTTQVAGGIISSGAEGTEDGFVLRFDWDEPVAAAVFRRGSGLWMVFDKNVPINVDAMRQVAGDSFVELNQLAHPTATVLRAITARGINPVPKREGLSWLMGFAKQSLSTLSPVEALSQPDSPVGARVFLSVPEPGNAVALTDPEMGDNFVVVPVIPLGYGVTHRYEYPQFRIRPSSQGLVIEPRIDNLRVRSVREGVGVTSTRTLHVSPVSEADIASARADSDRPMSRIVDLKPLQKVSRRFFNEERRVLEYAVATAPGAKELLTTRKELVRFLLAHGYAAEALGVLSIVAEDDPPARLEADYRLYRGMANFLMHRYADAREDLLSTKFDKNDEGIFWRSLVDFADGSMESDVLRGLRSTARVPDPYPRSLRISQAMWVIEASVAVQDAERARSLIDGMAVENLTPNEQSRLTYLSGLTNEAAGEFDLAIGDWETVMAGEHRPSTVHAAMKRTELLLKMDRIGPLEAIDELEKLRFAWRGGEFEFNLLRRMGALYLHLGGYRQGLRTLRQAATHFRDHKDAQQVTQEMSDIFAKLFLENEADKLPPVAAIAIYDEFKELTPVGELGDEMIRMLADRLVGVDLLDEASDLLDEQIKFRLKDEERARVGARLAVVRLFAKDYDGAMKALDLSVADGLPTELVAQRTQLRARATMGLGDAEGALVLLDNDESPESEQLRAEIYWNNRDWVRAGQSMRELTRISGASPGAKLSAQQARLVLDTAIALTLSGNDRSLVRLRQDFGPAMLASDLRDAFILISTPEQFGLIDFNSIAGKVRMAENFQSFLTAYRERLKSDGLSAIN